MMGHFSIQHSLEVFCTLTISWCVDNGEAFMRTFSLQLPWKWLPFSFPAEDAPDSDRKDLLSELELMKKLKPHPHVIKLIGCVTQNGK